MLKTHSLRAVKKLSFAHSTEPTHSDTDTKTNTDTDTDTDTLGNMGEFYA